MQIYSFVLTNTNSKWRFGFCRHDTNTSVAMVVITYLPWHDTFMKFLNILGELKKSDNGEFLPFLTETYVKGIPEPGSSLKLFYNAGVNVSILILTSFCHIHYIHYNCCWRLILCFFFFWFDAAFYVSTAFAFFVAQHTGKS